MTKLTSHNISRLLYRSIIGKLSDDERAQLDAWLEEDPDNRKFVEGLADPLKLHEELRAMEKVNFRRASEYTRRKIYLINRRRYLRRAAVAASLALIIGCGAWFAINHQLTMEDRKAENFAQMRPVSIEEIKPGTTRAILTSSTGQMMDLAGISTDENSVQKSVGRSQTVTHPETLCLDVPRGGEFKVVLEDSTVVWLNSQSSLRYPEVFAYDARRVKVTGEAYFEVSKDEDRPFYVESGGQVIRVYGTSFNVRAYKDEDAVLTTLEKGSVAVSPKENAEARVFLSPGHQTRFDNADSSVKMKEVNPEEVAGWRHGKFVFEEKDLATIMRDLSRWYDFSYEFADDSLRDIIFMGSVSRYSDFRTVISILERGGDVRFSVNQDKIIISRKN